MSTGYRESTLDKSLRKWFCRDLTRGLLRSIKLHKGSLRGLTKFSMPIDYPILAIAGRNGVGKSTMLALACCAFHNNKKAFKLKMRRTSYYTFSDFFVQHTEELPPEGIEIYYDIAYDRWKKTDTRPDGTGIGTQKRWKSQGGKWNNYAARVHSNVVFLGIDRIVPHSERSQSRSYSKSFLDADPHGWESNVCNAVGRIVGKNYDSLRYLEHSKYSLPIVQCGDIKYSGLNMGAGENALFEIFRVLYSCQEGALIVVDEIELGLHIDAQRKLIDELKKICLKRKVQVICTTHSKEIFSSLPVDARKFIELNGGITTITEGLSPDYAMSKLGALEVKELDVLVEDGVARDILSLALPTNIRQRVNIIAIGSATALSGQLASSYLRDKDSHLVIVFDGDQRRLESDNLKHAKKLVENPGEDFYCWIRKRISYLPGETWPEAWLLEANKPFLDSLSKYFEVDESLLAEYIEYGLQAGKHNEFDELSKNLGLSVSQCIQAFVTNLKKNENDLFREAIAVIDDFLN